MQLPHPQTQPKRLFTARKSRMSLRWYVVRWCYVPSQDRFVTRLVTLGHATLAGALDDARKRVLACKA